MGNLFTYTKTEGQGWLVEKPEMIPPDDADLYSLHPIYQQQAFAEYGRDYQRHLESLRRFKYDYPDPGKEMELGKDFEVMINHFDQKEWRAIPITQRTYSERDLLDVWEASWKYYVAKTPSPDKADYFKQKFGIEIK